MGKDNASEVRIATPKHPATIAVRFLGPYVGIITHWHAGRGKACPGKETCPRPVHSANTHWKGYAPGQEYDAFLKHWVFKVIEVTAALEHHLRGRTLRGEAWSLMRDPQKGDRGEVLGVYLETFDTVPPPFDIKPVVQRCYGQLDIQWDAPNPLPPPVILEPTDDRAPRIPEEYKPEPVPTGREAGEVLKRELERKRGARASANGQCH